MSATHYETIIVGLGAAGVAAAATLGRAGRRVLALEGAGRVGGRVWTRRFGGGLVELGAEWVHGSYRSPTAELATQHHVPLVPQDLELAAYCSDGSRPDQRAFSTLVDTLFALSYERTDEPQPLGQFLTKRLTEHLKTENPELLKDKQHLAMVLEFTNQFMNNYNASNDWDEVSTHSGYEELAGHQHLSWHRHGYSTMFDLLLNKEVGFPTVDIRLNSEVTQIEWPQDPREPVTVTCASGAAYTARQVIVTVSLGVLKERHTTLFKPPLPPYKVEAIESIAMGVMDKIELAFDEVWWPLDAVFFCFLWREEDRLLVPARERWVTRVFAASRPLGAGNVLTLWTSGDVAKLVETLPLEEVSRCSRALLQRFMGAGRTVPEPSAVERSRWYSDRLTRGSYSFDAVWSPAGARAALAAPLGGAGGARVLFAGEATHERHHSTVHGALSSGRREAARLLPAASKL